MVHGSLKASSKTWVKVLHYIYMWINVCINLMLVFEGEKRTDLLTSVKALQKETAKQGKKKRKLIENEMKRKKIDEGQTKLVQFGIVHYKKAKKVGYFL